MRIPIIAGNWKMYKTVAESVEFAMELIPRLTNYSSVEQVVAPTYLAIPGVANALVNSRIKVAAQSVHWEDEGAFTSQVSPVMLKGLVDYTIIGHSECRAYLAETDETVNKKAKALLSHGLRPIIAVGENLEQNQAGSTEAFVGEQVRAALEGVSSADMTKVIIAYEPIWAIGTGLSASGEAANRIIGMIRNIIQRLYNDEIAEHLRIQYGGSVKPGNMAEFMSQPEIDGALVGGASLNATDFAELVRIAQEQKGT